MRLSAGTFQAFLVFMITVSFILSPLVGSTTTDYTAASPAPEVDSMAEKLENIIYGVDKQSVGSSYPYYSDVDQTDVIEDRIEEYKDVIGASVEDIDPSVIDRDAERVLVYAVLEHKASSAGGYNLEIKQTRNYGNETLVRAYIPIKSVDDLMNESWTGYVGVRNPTSFQVSEGVGVIGADNLHEMGVEGKGVKVGVIGRDFSVLHPKIRDRVMDYKKFFEGEAPRGHGTAVAEIVTDTAPESGLYLAATGRDTTPRQYGKAVSWLNRQDVDVIVYSGSFLNQPYDGNGTISNITQRTVDKGTVFVTSTGNYGDSHWEGKFEDENGDNWMEFSGTDANVLAGGEIISGYVDVRMSWNDWTRSGQDYDLYLYRYSPESDQVYLMERSIRKQTGSQKPYEVIRTNVPPGRYYVAVYNQDASGENKIELFSNHRLGYINATGSITSPATAEGVISVGAFDHVTGNVEAFSSRGPTTDGRLGVDIVAPNRVNTMSLESDFNGTSAAAPYVAGVAALILSERPELEPEDVKEALTSTASDTGPEGTDYMSGHGKLDAVAAFTEASSTSLNSTEESEEKTLNEIFISELRYSINSSTNDTDEEIDIQSTNNTADRSRQKAPIEPPNSTDSNSTEDTSDNSDSDENMSDNSTDAGGDDEPTDKDGTSGDSGDDDSKPEVEDRRGNR